MLGAMHFLVWLRDRKAWPSLVFAVVVLGVVGHALVELGFMTARDPEVYGRYMRWSHLFSFLIIAGAVIFMRLYLKAGRWWLAGAIIGLRFVAMLMNFWVFDTNINYIEIRSLEFVTLLGQEVAIAGDADINRWMWMAQATFPLWFLFTVDATITSWRRAEQVEHRGLLVGCGMALVILLGTSQAVLALNGWIKMPMAPSIAFGLMTLAMGYELSRDVLRASQLATSLWASEQRLNLAAAAGSVVLWEWRAGQDSIWASSSGHDFFDLPLDQRLSFEHFKKTLHPEDRDRVISVINQTVAGGGSFSMEYRRLFSDGKVRWLAGSGSAERDPSTGATLLRGVSVDITESYATKESLREQREQLSHALRLATMSQMAASLAHELNQPLAAIVNNANAARRMMAKGSASPEDLVDIFADIAADGQRAGGVIRSIRAMARPEEQERMEISFDNVIADILPLITAEARERRVEVVVEIADTLPRFWGNPVQIQQILLNLTINAMDALDALVATERKVEIRAEAEGVSAIVVSVRDFGSGLPPAGADRIFEPFFTTKANGLGMGLAIVRSLVEAHGGSIGAADADGGGARFQMSLPVTA
jgi:signal transduction histidine kinase